MNTTENNKIIAKFMGITFINNVCRITDKLRNTPLEDAEYLQAKDANLPFNSDWNWLMEVVEKIEKTRRSQWSKYTFACVKISSLGCEIIFYGNRKEIISDIVRPSKIESVYDACINFIKWYNEQK